MLAIILPYYKITFFEATLQSLSAQTCQDFKVYIGDDASPEDPAALLERFQGQFNFVYHRFESNLGGTSLTQQWERCIVLSDNEPWLMILGDDDVLGENVVEAFYQNLHKMNQEVINVVRFATQIIDEKGEIITTIYLHKVIEKSTDFLVKKFSKQTRSSLSEYIFKKSVVLDIGFRNFPIAWHADDMAVLEFSNFGNCYSINESLVYVRLSSMNLTGDGSLDDLKNSATFEFCKVLFEEYSSRFTLSQKAIILKKLEMAFWNIPSFKHYGGLVAHYAKQLGGGKTIGFLIGTFRTLLILFLKKTHLFSSVHLIHSKLYKK
ncbi:glycosyltransferase family 2 protein [Flavobacterium succinicans]|uniref:Glycosyl transferase family 2 n=1 Tax=Flavobacterium succinicans TaxID=29536 RepID=A0A199XVQ3_9FLAO|nr:glycosyltransferase family A protein [Flavobacterium succinicans]OAZ05409.1 glycosyl transferase family 2 [Flavobacterium succinicans]